jgi:hypothetical protein
MSSTTRGWTSILVSSFYAAYGWLYSYSRWMWP